ncbi:hypothetical protein [Geofilum rubicundum]|uniref:Lipoprotein n=1 Tax=Geofilum rubicundum JCM 15548 TaxID=1236989 RepID=A0A0E9LYK4_9BACT|nr:hypothetical protein [Geofilum rubicundum]GAO29935.1 hypothetical protein JCM15548_12170 [Geofilum rubicundum JCM 15548]
MKIFLTLLVLVILLSCEKEDHQIDARLLKNYVIMDPYEDAVSFDDVAQDTVYYFFKENDKMTKVRLNYSLVDDAIILESRDTVECLYYTESNHVFMTVDWDNETMPVPGFGKDFNEWAIVKLNSDTLVVDWFQNGESRIKVGRVGFSVI